MLETLDDAAVHRWCGGGLAALRAHQHEIDELNVYPVPDGDTGTNLVLTLTSAAEALESPSEQGRAMRRMARGALLGARGNSGVIVSQIFRGMADSFASVVAVRGAELASALRTASEAAYAAVARPVEGTVLSVVAAAAEAAGRLKSDDVRAVARAAARAASEALARTPQQLPVLARAGVVDAGGRGLVLLLDALVEALGPPGERALPPVVVEGTTARAKADETPEPGLAAGDHAGDADLGFEVQYLVDATADAVEVLRERLAGLGDSLVVVGSGDGTWNVHVHVPVEAIGRAIEAGVEAGRPHRIDVTPLVDRVGHHHEPTPRAPDPPSPGGRGAVVVAAGEGLMALLAAEGAVVVDRNPSIAEMLAAVGRTGAGRVVLLPNDDNTHAVATAAAKEASDGGVRVSVVPTSSPVQALAALAVRDPGRSFADDVIAMAEAAGACRYGEVCTAQRESLTVAGRCRPGDLLGLVDGEVHIIGDDLATVACRLADRMLGGGGELVTLVLGADAPDGLGETLTAHIGRVWPFAEVQCLSGGQPRYHLLVGVE